MQPQIVTLPDASHFGNYSKFVVAKYSVIYSNLLQKINKTQLCVGQDNICSVIEKNI